MNGPKPPAAGHSHYDAPEPVAHVHPDSTNVERGHNKEHSQDHDHRRGHTHDHDHGRNPTGVKGLFYRLFVVPHSHDAAESIDDAHASCCPASYEARSSNARRISSGS